MFRQDLCPRSLSEVLARLLKSLEGIFAQALYKSSFGKIFVRDLLLRSLDKISIRALCTRSLGKLCIRDLLVKISAQDLLDHPHEHRAATRAMWQAQSDERVPHGSTGDLTRAMSYGKFTGKCRTRRPGPAFSTSLRSRNAHGHFTRAILCGNLQENAGRVARGQRFTRACAVEMHMDISQEPFCVEIYKENAGCRNAHRHFTRAILCRNLQGKSRTRHLGPAFCASLRGRDAHGHFTSYFVRKFTGRMPDTPDTTSISTGP